MTDAAADIQAFTAFWNGLKRNIQETIVGQEDVIEGVMATLLASGHVLLEGVPGVGKTTLVRALAGSLGLISKRIQFTPDLMPSDITGSDVLQRGANGETRFEFQEGPLFANVVLADEINRATPKTQSALLEVMEERQVTVGGVTRVIDRPFMVLATQNPVEMDGTYQLPEAQLDRFMVKLQVKLPNESDLISIMGQKIRKRVSQLPPIPESDRHAAFAAVERVVIAEATQRSIARVVRGTHPTTEGVCQPVSQYVELGASPRAALAIQKLASVFALAAGRPAVSDADWTRAAYPVLRHRYVLSFEGLSENVNPDTITRAIIEGA